MRQNKVKIYIDGANIFYTQKRLGWFIDWIKVKNIIEKEKEVAEWKYYVGVKDGDEKMMDYIKYLNNIGFDTITKPLKKIKVIKDEIFFKTQEREFIYKANFDVEMTADILLDKSKLDEIIIFSGDSDFRYLVKKLKDTGIKTIVYSSRKTISWELKLEISKIVYFEDIKDKILRQ
jgi:uncharacterized LabA/DUF88 family protein